MFKKIINPIELLEYRKDGIDNKYLINEGSRAIGIFAATAGVVIPTQISPQDVCFYVIEGKLAIQTEDKFFELNEQEMILIPKTTAYTLNFTENAKIFTVRL